VLFAALAVGPVWNAIVFGMPAAMMHDELLPQPPPDWQGPTTQATAWRPVFAGADKQAIGVYRQQERIVEVFRAEYAYQQQGKEIDGYLNTPIGEGSTIDSSSPAGAVPSGFAEQRVAGAPGSTDLVWYGYHVGPTLFASAFQAQVWYGLRSLFGPPLSGVIALRTSCDADCAAARQSLLLMSEQARLIALYPSANK
jgi:hypothetical protein